MILAFDTETELITPTCKAPRLICVSYYAGEGEPGLVSHSDAEPLVRSWLESDATLVGQNLAYDFGVVLAEFPELTSLVWKAYEDGRVEDTQVREKLIRIALGENRSQRGYYSLEQLAKRYIRGWQLDKDTWRLRYGEFRGMPIAEWPDGAQTYAKLDAAATYIVHQKQQERRALLEDQHRQARAAWWIHLVSAWGVRTDIARALRLEKQTLDDYTMLEEALMAEGLVRRDKKRTRDTKVAKARMVAAVGEEGAKRTRKKGQVSLDREACADSHDEMLEAYAELSSLKDLITKDIPYLKLGEVHSRFESLLETGRTSSSDPNIQNLKRKGGIRECYVPRPGYLFVDCDYDGIELRTFAQVCRWAVKKSRLAEALNDGYDPHLSLGAQLLQIPYEDAFKRYKAGDPEVKEARQRSKPANFGYPGGMGAATFARWTKAQYGIVITEDQAIELRASWFRTWPEVNDYFAWIRDKHEWRTSFVTGDAVALATQFVSGRYRGGVPYPVLCNTYFQGLASDIGKFAGFLIGRACYDESQGNILYGSRIVNFVHDEFLVEVPDDARANDCAVEIARLMVEGAKPFVPDVPATCEPLLCRRWSKDAKSLYDGNGRLVPWEAAS